MDDSPLYTPRAHIEATALPADFTLPELHLVRWNVARWQSIKENPAPSVLCPNTTTGRLPEPLAYNCLLPELFKWSFFVSPGDVPMDLVEPCIWTSKMQIRMFDETTENDLHVTGWLLPHQTGPKADHARYFKLQE